ncbi:hypothetical protein QQG74_06965 [Micromonospora sp. FIMYZ51]|uniref:hypothetical protein n=1 Tax=Micromonospora sp. FIMYZ51 TaxID=3051832 RepID=UPI00311F7BFD
MSTDNRHLRLWYGFRHTRAGRLTTVLLLGLPAVGFAACLGTVLSWVTITLLDVADIGSADAVGPLLYGIPGLFVAAMAGWWVWSLLAVLRTAAWLDGTRLTVQRVRPRTVDLVTANSIGLRPTNRRFKAPPPGVTDDRVPELLVAGPDGSVRLPLLVDTGTLPPRSQLVALAEMLATIQRPGAAEVAQELHALANRAPWG